jgi:hypothetical protein
MNKTLKVTFAVILSFVSMPVDSIARSARHHKIGFLSTNYRTNCYLANRNRRENNVIFGIERLIGSYHSGSFIKIDGKIFLLKHFYSSPSSQDNNNITKYNTELFQVRTVLRRTDNIRGKDKYDYGSKGTISVIHNDGWQKNINVECITTAGE